MTSKIPFPEERKLSKQRGSQMHMNDKIQVYVMMVRTNR